MMILYRQELYISQYNVNMILSIFEIFQNTECYSLIKNYICSQDVPQKCKITIYKIYFKQELLYGTETWPLINNQQNPGSKNENF